MVTWEELEMQTITPLNKDDLISDWIITNDVEFKLLVSKFGIYKTIELLDLILGR